MGKRLLVIILGVMLSVPVFADNPGQITFSENAEGSVLTFSLGTYELKQVETPWGKQFKVVAEGATPLLQQGAPDLPKFHTSLAIDNFTDPEFEVVDFAFTDVQNIDIAPSKGNFTRDILPADVPFIKGESYNANAFWPENILAERDPYIIRDIRGKTVLFQPFSYNPQTRVLRIYTKIVAQVKNSTKSSGINTLEENNRPVEAEFHEIYKRHFINYSSNASAKSAYPVISEEGKMLIICHPAFMQEMAPFVSWKKQRGLAVKMVGMNEVGATYADIKSYVSDYYLDSGLTYLLLVGDHAQVPAGIDGFGNYSDNYYGFLNGQDFYPEVFVGRFSAENISHVATQVQRSVEYEKSFPASADWLGKAVGIGSSEGPGDDNEMDYEHIRNIGLDLTSFTYTQAFELFEGSQGGADNPGNPTAADLANILNAGAGIINYTGHGASYCSVTTGFSSNDVLALNNMNKLPYFWSVACSNGEFMFGTCYAEHWLRANKNGVPTGAMGVLMATILQSWAPPMEGQDEMNLILSETYSNNIKRTFTGISMHGCMAMNDAYGVYGDEMTSTWATFGDPSLLVRTAAPAPMTVSHPVFKALGTSSLLVSSNTEGALVSLTMDGEIIGTGTITNGQVIINFNPVNNIDTILVTATAFNKITYTGEVFISGQVGIKKTTNSGFTTYPNPVLQGNDILIRLNESGNSTIILRDMEGRTISRDEIKGTSPAKISTSGLSAGVYFLQVNQSSGKQWIEKITIR